MIYKIAILDDEVLIRKSIILKIDSSDYQVVFHSDDGELLIDYMKEKGPWSVDLVLVDIEMPLMNGFDVIDKVREINKDMIFVIISGHNDFNNMQNAIRKGVSDYILKPIRPDNLNEVMRKFHQKLIAREQEFRTLCLEELTQHLSQRGDGGLSHRAKMTFDNYFTSGFKLSLRLLGNLDSDLSWSDLQYEDGWSLIYPGRPNLLISFIKGSCHTEDMELGTVTEYVSIKQNGLSDLYQLIEHGISVIRENIVLGKHTRIIQGNEKSLVEIDIKNWRKKADNCVDMILRFVRNKDFEKALEKNYELFTYKDVPQRVVEDIWLKIAYEVGAIIKDNGSLVGGAWLRKPKDESEFREYVTNAMKAMLNLENKEEHVRTSKDVIKEILEYFEDNYYKDIALSDIAERFYINRSHLSRVFKKETGKTFVEYVTSIRMKKACFYLENSDKSIQEISYLIGYGDSRYFSQLFNRHKGLTPTKYRSNSRLKG